MCSRVSLISVESATSQIVAMTLQKCPFDPFTYILIWQMSAQRAQSSALTAVQCARDV